MTRCDLESITRPFGAVKNLDVSNSYLRWENVSLGTLISRRYRANLKKKNARNRWSLKSQKRARDRVGALPSRERVPRRLICIMHARYRLQVDRDSKNHVYTAHAAMNERMARVKRLRRPRNREIAPANFIIAPRCGSPPRTIRSASHVRQRRYC